MTATWNGELIVTGCNGVCWTAVLDSYDPTPWDPETSSRGPFAHAKCGIGRSEPQAICDLLEMLIDP